MSRITTSSANERVDSQYGHSQDNPANDNAAQPNGGSAGSENGNANAPTNDEIAADEPIGDNDNGQTSPIADRIVTVVSHWAEDFSSNWGPKMSQIMEMLKRIQ